MIQIKPEVQHRSNCPYCGVALIPKKVLWQGIHICVVANCHHCHAEVIEDLKVGHALYMPYQVDLRKNALFGEDKAKCWLGMPLLKSLQNPKTDSDIEFKVEKFQDYKNVIILNCIDFLYGHALLRLLNAERHLKNNSAFGLVLLVPTFLRWMVPRGVAEVWTVNIPLSKAQNYFPRLDQSIQKESQRFVEIYVSHAHSHPKDFNITNFSGIDKHDFMREDFRITFIWREDRPWWSHNPSLRVARKLNYIKFMVYWQNYKICRLFSLLRKKIPEAKFTVTGLGTSTKFPKWIDDKRVEHFNESLERKICKIYSESRLIIGVHGSNMLLPSAHAGMALDLMPYDRWSNFAQDVLYQECDNRLSSYRYRYLPLNISASLLAFIVSLQIKGYSYFKKQMLCNTALICIKEKTI